MKFENTEEKRMLLMLVMQHLASMYGRYKEETDPEVSAFVKDVLEFYKDNRDNLEEIMGESCNGEVCKFSLDTAKKLFKEF